MFRTILLPFNLGQVAQQFPFAYHGFTTVKLQGGRFFERFPRILIPNSFFKVSSFIQCHGSQFLVPVWLHGWRPLRLYPLSFGAVGVEY